MAAMSWNNRHELGHSFAPLDLHRRSKQHNKQRKENNRALKLRKDPVMKNRAELARVSGVARTGKQARKQLRNARRLERNQIDDAEKKKASASGETKGGDVEMVPRGSGANGGEAVPGEGGGDEGAGGTRA